MSSSAAEPAPGIVPTCRLIVMAKAPLPGLTKTRLIPALGAAGAAALAERLLDHTINQALDAGLGPVDLCCTPDPGHPALARHAGRQGLTLSAQGEGDLGQRMARAFARWLAPKVGGARRTGRALMIGTDAPALDAAMLRKADAALDDETDAVFVPAFDGGYALIGLRLAAPSLFSDIEWSTASVMARTRERLAAAGLRHCELPPVHDIDEPADLAHLPPALR